MNLQAIKNKNDLIYLVDMVLENRIEIDNKKDFLLSLRDKIIELLLKEGDIPKSEWINLYFLFDGVNIGEDEFISQNIKVLEDYYNSATIDEKLLLNNVIFILKMLNSDDWLEEYVENFFKLNIYQVKDKNEFKIFYDFMMKQKDVLKLIGIVRRLIHNMKSYDLYTIKNIYANMIVVMWNIKALFGNKIWLEVFDDLVDLLEFFIRENRIEEQMNTHFFTYHIYGNNIQTIKEWRVFNEKVEKPASEFYAKWGEKNLLHSCKKRVSSKNKKIGFIIDRIVNNSPMKVIYSLLKALSEDEKFNKEYEIYVYSMCYAEKQVDNEDWVNKIKNLGIKVYSTCEDFKEYGIMYPHLEKAVKLRDKIIEDKIDYLVSTAFGYDISNFIFSNRSAPKQIFWSHGNCTTDIKNIDLRISHFSQECEEYEWKIFKVLIAEEFLIGSEEDKKKAKMLKKSLLETYGKDTVFLGTIGRYVKIDSDEYLKTIAEIMKQNPNTVYLACGDGNVESIKNKLKKYDIPPSRFVFTGLVNPHIFGWVIDVWLDSFPLWQGQSAEEFRMKGGILIRKKVDEKPTYDEFEKVLKQASIEEIYEGKAKIDLKDINLPPKYVKLLNEAISGNKESLVFLILHLGFVSNERYLEIANFFIKHKELRDICKNLDKTLLLESGGYHKADINDFLKILKGEK